MENMLNRTEEMAMYLYTTINNIRQLQVLMMNPHDFASMSQHEQGKDGDFKRNPTLEGMLGYLKQEIFGTHIRRGDVRSRQRLLRELDESTRKRTSTGHSHEQPRSKSTRTSRRRSPLASETSEEEQTERVSKSRGKSARKTRRTSYTSDQQSERTRTVQLLGTSSSEKEAPVTTKKSSQTRHSTMRQTRPKRSSKTDVSYSEQEAGEMDTQERSKRAKRITRVNVSPYAGETELPVRLMSPNEPKTTRSERRLQRSVPQTSTPQTEHRVYEGRVTRSRTAATRGRQRVSRYFEELQQQSQGESEQSLPTHQERNSRLRFERSESAQSSESENTTRQMETTLSSVRSKRGKQTAVKPRSPIKRKTTSKKQPLKETAPSKKPVPVTSEVSSSDLEDTEMLASLAEKNRKQRAMKRAPQKKDTTNLGNKQSCEQVDLRSDEELFMTQKTPTAEPSQVSPTQLSDRDRDDMSQSNDDEQ